MKSYCIFTLWLAFYIMAPMSQAQSPSDDERLNVIPTSPNANSLGKYGSLEANTYTRSAEASVNIWEIKLTKIGLQVSLNYLTCGCRTTDVASRVWAKHKELMYYICRTPFSLKFMANFVWTVLSKNTINYEYIFKK
jgi:hypothetical protein